MIESPRHILISRLDGLGDIALSTGLLASLRAAFPAARIMLLIRREMGGIADLLDSDVELIPLPFDPRLPVQSSEAEVVAAMTELLPHVQADWAIAGEYNRVWAGELLLAACGATRRIAFNGFSGLTQAHLSVAEQLSVQCPIEWETVPVAADEREPLKYLAMLRHTGLEPHLPHLPRLRVNDDDKLRATNWWRENHLSPERTVLFFPDSGDGSSRSLPIASWRTWIEHLTRAGHQAAVLTAHGNDHWSPLSAVATLVSTPLADTALLGGVVASAKAFFGADTGPTHLAALLGTPTLSVFGGGHQAHRFLPVGPRVNAARMPISCYGCDWLCPFDRRHCIQSIPMDMLIEIGDVVLADQASRPPLEVRLFDIAAPVELQSPTMGAAMRNHRAFLAWNHAVNEHHAFLASELAGVRQAIAKLSQVDTEMTQQNQARDAAIAHLNNVIAEMTRHNQARDAAIHLLGTQNVKPDATPDTI